MQKQGRKRLWVILSNQELPESGFPQGLCLTMKALVQQNPPAVLPQCENREELFLQGS